MDSISVILLKYFKVFIFREFGLYHEILEI